MANTVVPVAITSAPATAKGGNFLISSSGSLNFVVVVVGVIVLTAMAVLLAWLRARQQSESLLSQIHDRHEQDNAASDDVQVNTSAQMTNV